jgi:transcriptional antiterminator RfaH
MTRWFVVRTHSNAEVRAKEHLERQGFMTYLPRYLKLRRHARRVERVSAPLFPRYLFVAFDPLTTRWRAICSTIGVCQLISHGDVPAPVPDDVIKALQAQDDEQGFSLIGKKARFAIGEKVRVVAGAFADTIGQIYELGDHERVIVLLDLLGRQVRTRFAMDAISADI